MEGRGPQALLPRDLAVVMGVDIHESRRDDASLGVDLLLALAGDAPDLSDAPVANRHVCGERHPAEAVDHRPAANDQTVLDHSHARLALRMPIRGPPPRDRKGVV